MSVWSIDIGYIRGWLQELSDADYMQVVAALEVLEGEGPSLGRPLVDSIKGSKHRHMKELRPGSSGNSEIRILFAFDPLRQAILLVAGDKAGQWEKWYRKNIPRADRLYQEHLDNLKKR
ncbi:MAG: type II toxin-antitoxin system RelE/ParE family toxin [Rothia sp. (in: high G+C Gram-positive bacteria)]|uniref:type II toxin-antitoxin system RelE/ParE family toxin n=1 Tax=Rothia sp. (in: high G+C Gram-positive bacteria) TaxID=1885016 RepID=UPI0026DB257B|nr:type II toxin-antitoxin system RelE/ParE family toxin [Rothia sp. (in: high G+C Gram-positive bacteria)]MDO4884307.1 type II toxin-antitoxin system RelE/ParE family toxin [Rothia sp. (in: high G+C Gram-positive bacteria)]